MKNWKIYHDVLGFRAFDEDHSSENIRNTVLSFISMAYNMEENQVNQVN